MTAPRTPSPGLDAAQRQVLIDLHRGLAADLCELLPDLDDLVIEADRATARRLLSVRDGIALVGSALDDAADALGGTGRTADWSRHAGVLRSLRDALADAGAA